MYMIIGSSGYIAQKFIKRLNERGLDYLSLSRENFDYYDFEKVSKAVLKFSPKIIINCGGYVGKPNVDECELNKEETCWGNIELPKVLAKISYFFDVKLGHISSGCIYSGLKEDGSGFSENDAPNFSFENPPCSFYSGTKAEAEKVIQSITDYSYIWRLRIPFDEYNNERNYISKLLNYEKLHKATNSISHVGDFVNACIDSVEKKIPTGIYNVVNGGAVATERVAEKIKDYLKIDKEFRYWENDEEFYESTTKTPRSNCVLDNSKIINQGISIRSAEDALDDALKNWKP